MYLNTKYVNCIADNVNRYQINHIINIKPMRTLLLVMAVALGFTSCAVEPNTLTEKEKQDGWELLFDGTSLDGWRRFNTEGTTGWEVIEGCMVASGQGGDIGGDLVTTSDYENFIICFDWNLESQGNSGFMYHVLEGKKYKAPYVTGPEYQMLDDDDFPGDVETWQITGADYAMTPPINTDKIRKKAGEWNNTKIVFNNGHVEHWLNGVKVVEFEAWTKEWFENKDSGKWKDMPEYGLSHIGKFCFQDHGAVAKFKNIKIKELPREDIGKEVNLFNGKDLTGWNIHGTEKWYVENGLLVCESGPERKYGYLSTDEYYKNFDLSVKFKQEADGNSGIFFRSTFVDTKVSGWQVEVAPKGNGSGGVYESYGRGWLHQINEKQQEALIVGEWNTMRIKVVDGHVTTWLNGEQMVDFEDNIIAPANGRIALQIHDNADIKVLWKDLKLTVL